MVALRYLVYEFLPYMYYPSPHVLYNFIAFVLPDVRYLVPKHVSSKLFSPFVIPYSLPKLLPFWLYRSAKLKNYKSSNLEVGSVQSLGLFVKKLCQANQIKISTLEVSSTN
jgi:hypothetical protein